MKKPHDKWMKICILRMEYLWKEYPFRNLFLNIRVDCPKREESWLADNARDAASISSGTKEIIKKNDYEKILISLSEAGLPAKLTHEFAALTYGCQNFEYKLDNGGLLPSVDTRRRSAHLKRLERDLSSADLLGSQDDIRRVLADIKNERTKIAPGKRGPREQFYRKDSLLDLFVYIHACGGIKSVEACKQIGKILVCFGLAPSSVREDFVREAVNRAGDEFLGLVGMPR